MENHKNNTQLQGTEKLIMEAAKKIFGRKGLDGARMQEIADEAGINKALVHYYFRSKDKLFEAVINETFLSFFPKVMSLMSNPSISLFQKIKSFVDLYITLIQENPHIPGFMAQELSKGRADRILELLRDSGLKPEVFFQQIEQEIKTGTIVPVNPVHLFVNMISMCIFPFLARPLISGFLIRDRIDYDEFLEERKKELPKFIINSIKKK
jgi:AcrR family transcriptional regulator